MDFATALHQQDSKLRYTVIGKKGGYAYAFSCVHMGL
jgi:hypothetical protein